MIFPVDARESAQRQHLSLAAFAAMQCWIRNLNGVVIERVIFERYLGLMKFKESRVEWIIDDFKSYFKFHGIFYDDKELFSSIIFSRVDFATTKTELKYRRFKWYELPNIEKDFCNHGIDTLDIWDRHHVRELQKNQIINRFFTKYRSPDEHLVLSFMSLLVQGTIQPTEISNFLNQLEENDE